MDYTLIVPTFNERDCIGAFLSQVHALPDDLKEILVIDDGSTDGTSGEVQAWTVKDPRIRFSVRQGPRSLARSIREGIDKTKTDAVVWMDADLSMPVDLIPELVSRLNDSDVAVGSRYVGGGKDARNQHVRTFTSRFFNVVAALGTHSHVKDLTSGFIAARRNVASGLFWEAIQGEYCIEFLVKAERAGYRVVEIPYRNTPRFKGKSKTADSWETALLNFFRYSRKVCRLSV